MWAVQTLNEFIAAGWMSFAFDPAVKAWADHVLPFGRAATRDPAQAQWLRCGGTWFVGVDALPNDADGRVSNGPALTGAARDFIRTGLQLDLPLHHAQISICYPGYPQSSPEETPTAYQYRLKRDAAHVDGLHAEGPERRRFLREPHAYILGLPLGAASADAAPLVVWPGSHHIMKRAFKAALADEKVENWRGVDLTAIYQAARRDVFATCSRLEVPGSPGEAILLHRHLLHGVAPWRDGASAESGGRTIAYFRPELPMLEQWLSAP